MTITNSKTQIAVRKAEAGDRARATEVLTAGFFDDPVTEWIVADRGARPAILPPMFELYFDTFQPHGETYLTTDGAGTALWLPPNRELVPADQLEDFVRRTEAACGPYAARLFELDEFFAGHAPSQPHWHLQLLAVPPVNQGRGLGSALLADQLWRLDVAGEDAYLEATTLRGRALYERHGFECFGQIVLPGGPPLWQMWRAPR
jgi:GNAT superfamily N-acetyltransferase